MKYYSQGQCHLGDYYVIASDIAVEQVILTEEKWIQYRQDKHLVGPNDLTIQAVRQLNEYFIGERKYFELPLLIGGTVFQKAVWQQLLEIPYGKVKTYGEIAQGIGKPKASRAVGQANRANLLPIIIPCHRVIGHNQKMVGYMGDKIQLKQWLLDLEKVNG